MATLVVAASTMSSIPGEAGATGFPTQRPITINHDTGGSVYKYALNVARATNSGTQVRISGPCQSACTLFLAMPADQVCIEPGASFSFHRAYGAGRKSNQIGTDYMLGKYPHWVRSWIDAKGGLKRDLIHMNYAYASRFMNTCGSRAPAPVLREAALDAPVPYATPVSARAVGGNPGTAARIPASAYTISSANTVARATASYYTANARVADTSYGIGGDR